MSIVRSCCGAGIMLVLLVPTLSAQSVWIDQRPEKAIALEVLKANFDGDDGTSFATSSWIASLWLPVGANVRLVGELPFTHVGLDVRPGVDGTQDAIGNPYLGLEIRHPARRTFFELGLRLPLAPDDNFAPLLGMVTDLDRWEAFAPSTLSASGLVNYRYRAPTGLVTRFRAGPSFWIPTEGGDVEVLLAYSLQMGYDNPMVTVLGGFTGRAVVTADASFAEATFHQFGASASFGGGRVRPGAHLRVPVEDGLGEAIDVVFGLNLTIQLP